MKRRRDPVALQAGLLAVELLGPVLTWSSCGATRISLQEAIEIARQTVDEGGVMTLEGRDTEYEEKADHWRIFFPYSSHQILGGEPHVWVAKSNGEVIKIYYTQ